MESSSSSDDLALDQKPSASTSWCGPRKFCRPNGRMVHIARSPEEVDSLRRRLSALEKADFDVVVHGSPEHVEALRETHEKQEGLKAELREKYGDAVDEWENVIRDLDALSGELNAVSNHAVHLDANFSKYGHSAHLRARDSPLQSSQSSFYGDVESKQRDWNAERNRGSWMKFYRKPVIRQYFHKGLLWRAQEAQEVGSYELFVDLLYVGIIAISSEVAVHEATGQALLQFVITFVLGWKFWSDIAVIIGWFDADDIVRRLTVLFILTCLLGFTTNMAASWEDTYTPLISFYIASRIFVTLYFIVAAYLIPMVRNPMIGNAVTTFIPITLWVGSIYVEEPHRQGLIWTGIVIDLFGSFYMVIINFGHKVFGPRWQEWAKRAFEFAPAVSIEHRIERTNAFVTLVFGHSVLAILYQNKASFGINAFFGKAVLGLIQAFAFNWLYFEVDSFNLHAHAIRRHIVSGVTWFSAHLPFIMGYVCAGAALAVLVLAHDCEDADYHTLWHEYEERSHAYVTDGERWFYCGGLGVAMIFMSIISMTHVYKTVPGQWIPKWLRVTFRFLVAIVIMLLPLAHSLNSLHLVAATTGLVVLALIVELIGAASSCDNALFERNRDCSYGARCNLTKKELEASAKDGTIINVEEIAKRHVGDGEHEPTFH